MSLNLYVNSYTDINKLNRSDYNKIYFQGGISQTSQLERIACREILTIIAFRIPTF